MASAWDVSPDVVEFTEALTWFRRRTVLTGDEAIKLNDRAKAASFWIGGGLQLQQVQDVFQALDKSIAKGETFEEFRARLKVNLKPAHASIVFRNAAQRAYNAGRYEQLTQPDILKFRPFWQYDAVLDSRTTQICKSYDKTVRPANDEWWATRWPPNHHGCRGSVRALRRSEAERIGVTQTPTELKPAEGWSGHPLAAFDPPKGKDPALVETLKKKPPKRAKLRKPAATPAAPIPKGPPPEHTPEHWIPFFEKQGYKESAKSLAWGRAAFERGLDTPILDVDAIWSTLDRGGDTRFSEWTTKLEILMKQKKLKRGSTQTIRELFGETDSVANFVATVSAHMQAINPGQVVINKTGLSQKLANKLASVENVINKLVDVRVAHPLDYTIVVGTGADFRASCDSVLRRLNISSDNNLATLFHEWSHGIEDETSGLLARSVDWLNTRRGSEPLRPIADIDPHHKDDKQDTFRDQLRCVYIGKNYVSNVSRTFLSGVNVVKTGEVYGTEVTAMGATVLFESAAEVARDFEHLLFTLGQYSGQ